MKARIDIDDAGFVRAPTELVYRRLTDAGSWPTWWPGLEVRSLPPAGDRERWGISLRAGVARILRYGVTLHGWRHEQGFRLDMAGDLDGRAELWLEPTTGGTVVHHVASVAGVTRSAPREYRRGVRRGLWGLKDLLQLEMRTSVGMVP